MDNRLRKEHTPVFKLLRRRRNPPPSTLLSSARLADHQNKNRDSFTLPPKQPTKRSKLIDFSSLFEPPMYN